MRFLYIAPTDNTKPRHIRKSPNRQHNPPKDNTKPRCSAISNAPAWYGGPPRPGMGATPAWYGGHPGLVWGSALDWYGGPPGLVWGAARTGMGVAPDWYGGPGIRIINIGYIELGPDFCVFFTYFLPLISGGGGGAEGLRVEGCCTQGCCTP